MGSADDGDGGTGRTFVRCMLFALPVAAWVVWLFWRGSALAIPMAVGYLVATSPCISRLASIEERTTPEGAWERAAQRARTFANEKWSSGWKGRLELLAELPIGALGAAWLGLGTLILVRWGRWRGR